MKNFITKNYIYLIYMVVGVLVVYLISVIMNPKEDMSELDRYKLDEINRKITEIKNNQKKLDEKIENYNIELNKIDSTIAQVKNQKVTVKEYYRVKGEEIDKMSRNQIDSLLHKRYNF